MRRIMTDSEKVQMIQTAVAACNSIGSITDEEFIRVVTLITSKAKIEVEDREITDSEEWGTTYYKDVFYNGRHKMSSYYNSGVGQDFYFMEDN